MEKSIMMLDRAIKNPVCNESLILLKGREEKS